MSDSHYASAVQNYRPSTCPNCGEDEATRLAFTWGGRGWHAFQYCDHCWRVLYVPTTQPVTLEERRAKEEYIEDVRRSVEEFYYPRCTREVLYRQLGSSVVTRVDVSERWCNETLEPGGVSVQLEPLSWWQMLLLRVRRGR